jgi:endonuclease/exonuclease/phosphatase family metal-dependent hydrolase
MPHKRQRRRDIIILMGDFNAKIGGDNKEYEETMGKHGLGEMMAKLCATNETVQRGRLFRHKRIHKARWISLDQLTENQIDHVHVCISRKFRSSLQDVKVNREASEHHTLIAKLRYNSQPSPGPREDDRFLHNHLQ